MGARVVSLLEVAKGEGVQKIDGYLEQTGRVGTKKDPNFKKRIFRRV